MSSSIREIRNVSLAAVSTTVPCGMSSRIRRPAVVAPSAISIPKPLTRSASCASALVCARGRRKRPALGRSEFGPYGHHVCASVNEVCLEVANA